MSPWIFFALIAVAIAWFIFDRPQRPGEPAGAEVIRITPVPALGGHPKSKLVARLDDGAVVTLEVARNDTLNPGDRITLHRAKRRLSGIASYELVDN